MSTTTDTTAIDDKKTENNPDTTEPPQDWASFFMKGFLPTVGSLLMYIICGCIVLYLTKLSFAKVIPTNIELYPFNLNADNAPPPSPIDSENTDQNGGFKDNKSTVVDTNIVRGGKWFGIDTIFYNPKYPVYSTKIEFNTETANNEYGWLNKYIEKRATSPKTAGIFINFFSKVFSNTVSFNNWLTTEIFAVLYSWIAESILILAAPMLLTVLTAIYFIINWFVFIWYTIKNIGLIFKELYIDTSSTNSTNSTSSTTDTSSTNSTTDTSSTSYKNGKVVYGDLETPKGLFISALYFIIWVIFFWIGQGLYPIFMLFYSLLSPLVITGTDKNNNTKMNFSRFCLDVLKYKSQFLLFLFSIQLLSPSKTYLGTNGFIGCLAGIIICIFIFHTYNKNYNPGDDSNLSPIIKPGDAEIQPIVEENAIQEETPAIEETTPITEEPNTQVENPITENTITENTITENPITENPITENQPTVEENPITEETTPAIEETTPVTENQPTVEENPVTENSTAIEENQPTVEETPTTENQPMVEENPITENSPAIEETPTTENQPTVEETPTTEKPITENPITDQTPTVEVKRGGKSRKRKVKL